MHFANSTTTQTAFQAASRKLSTPKRKRKPAQAAFKFCAGLFKWEYTKPYQQKIVGDGKHIWLYDVDLKQVTQSNQNQAIGDSPASILSNKTALDASYSLKEDGSKDGIDYVLASPKKPTQVINLSALASKATRWQPWN